MEDILKIAEQINKTQTQNEEDLFDFSFVEKKEQELEKQIEKEKVFVNSDLEKYIEEQLKNQDVLELKKRTESEEWQENNYPSFEKIMELKQQYKNITLAEIGDKLEEAVFKIKQSLYILKPMSQHKYQDFIANVGPIAANLIAFTQYSIRECVLFPELDDIDLEEMPVGVGDIITNEIWKFSRFASTKKITRI